MSLISTRVKVISAGVVVVAGLGVAVLNGSFTTPLHGTVLAAAAPTATAVATSSTRPEKPFAGRAFGMIPGMINNVAGFLGMNASDLQTALRNGQTLAQIAQAHGKTATDLENALLNAEKARIDRLINTNFQQLRQQRAGQATPNPTTTSR